MSYYWTFEVRPSGSFLIYYSGHRINFTIGEDIQQLPLNFLLNSPHFEKKSKANEVFELATLMINLINGHTKLIFIDEDEHAEIQLGQLIRNGEKVREKLTKSSSLDEVMKLLNPEVDCLGDILDLAFKDKFLRNILLYCNDGWTLQNMYKIIDEIKFLLKKNHDNIYNYVSKSDFKNFGAITNHYSISGLNARHGRSLNKAPKNPMSFEEASKFTRSLLKDILKKYYDLDIVYIPRKEEESIF